MMRRITTGVILGVLASLLALPVLATSGDCQTFNNHSGHVPGSYDYAEFYEDGQLITTVETFGEDVFVNPAGWDAGEDWDQVNKCEYSTTTTLPEETTTTIPEETTTTIPEVTTTTIAESTTTTPGLIETTFVITSVCLPDGMFEIDAEFGDGVDRIEVTVLDPMFPIDPDNFDGVILTPENPTTGGSVGGFAQFQATAFPREGYVIVGTNPVILDVDVCPQDTTTTTPTVTTQPDEPVLPFTGISREGIIGLIIAGVLTVGIGSVLVREFRSE